MAQKWKEAATVILASFRDKVPNRAYNYDVLTIKRSSGSPFMPNAYVFPGGKTNEADNSCKWLGVFDKFHLTVNSEVDSDSRASPILRGKGDFSKTVALKITAIRETFEETGILLCKKNEEHDKWASVLSDSDVHLWRNKIRKNAFEFINLCQHYNCYPDINGLHVWSNWLTPKAYKTRFDTIFFFSSIANIPATSADQHEIDDILWCSPDELLDQNEKKMISLAPPQIYELSRLLNFNDISRLNVFARDRVSKGCEQWTPVLVSASDGQVGLLPGDDAHTGDGDGNDLDVMNITKSQFHSKCDTLHRVDGSKILIKNYIPKNGHLLPVI